MWKAAGLVSGRLTVYVPLARSLGVVSAAVELRQRPGEPPRQLVVEHDLGVHGAPTQALSQATSPIAQVEVMVKPLTARVKGRACRLLSSRGKPRRIDVM